MSILVRPAQGGNAVLLNVPRHVALKVNLLNDSISLIWWIIINCWIYISFIPHFHFYKYLRWKSEQLSHFLPATNRSTQSLTTRCIHRLVRVGRHPLDKNGNRQYTPYRHCPQASVSDRSIGRRIISNKIGRRSEELLRPAVHSSLFGRYRLRFDTAPPGLFRQLAGKGTNFFYLEVLFFQCHKNLIFDIFSGPSVSNFSPCSPFCPGVTGIPELECSSCHSLFHPVCVGIPQNRIHLLASLFRCKVGYICSIKYLRIQYSNIQVSGYISSIQCSSNQVDILYPVFKYPGIYPVFKYPGIYPVCTYQGRYPVSRILVSRYISSI